MPRWLWWTPIALFAAFTAVIGLRFGYATATATETDVINRYAQQYLQDRARAGTAEGAALTDCMAYPGDEPQIWLRVVCGPYPADKSGSYEYAVDRLGRLVRARVPGSGGLIPWAGSRSET